MTNKTALITGAGSGIGRAVATAFLSLLASASAKFKVVPERYVNYYNPAYLGGMERIVQR